MTTTIEDIPVIPKSPLVKRLIDLAAELLKDRNRAVKLIESELSHVKNARDTPQTEAFFMERVKFVCGQIELAENLAFDYCDRKEAWPDEHFPVEDYLVRLPEEQHARFLKLVNMHQILREMGEENEEPDWLGVG